MTTPLATIAESIIEFILSLLRDPDAAADFSRDPEGALARSGLGGVSAADVRAVAPVIYDRDDIVPRAGSGSADHASNSSPTTAIQVNVPQAPPPTVTVDPVVAEFTRITTSVTTIDNRSTIVDQSVNQNIWTEGGDVTQLFDQAAGVATGDDSTAAGDDVSGVGDEQAADAPDGLDELDALLTAGADAAGDLDDGLDAIADATGGADGADTAGTDSTADADGSETAADAAGDAFADDGSDLDGDLAAAEAAGVPAEAVDAVGQATGADAATAAASTDAAAETATSETATTDAAAGAAPAASAGAAPAAGAAAYEAAAESAEEAAWTENDDAGVVDDVAYADEMTEEQ